MYHVTGHRLAKIRMADDITFEDYNELIDSQYGITARQEHIRPWPFGRGYVSFDVQLAPCCLIANPEVSDPVDARELNKTWNGTKMSAFRRAR